MNCSGGMYILREENTSFRIVNKLPRADRKFSEYVLNELDLLLISMRKKQQVVSKK